MKVLLLLKCSAFSDDLLVGIVTNRDVDFITDRSILLKDVMTTLSQTSPYVLCGSLLLLWFLPTTAR